MKPDGPPQEHVGVLIHGIRDFADWQSVIRHTLEANDLKVELTNYMRFDLLRFLAPFKFFRRKVIDNIWLQIEQIKELHPGAKISFIAHSFGTYILSEILQQRFNFQVYKVIFCGSIVRYKFPFQQINKRFSAPVINEVGTKDIWPALAESVTFGYGSSGTYGFRRPYVRDRWHNDN